MLQETSSVGLFFLPADDKFFMQVFLFFQICSLILRRHWLLGVSIKVNTPVGDSVTFFVKVYV